ncbi:hypothetical protein GCM10011352_16440 [Marinobacterium zhoushanense]|uniref:histidine kinase n=1 Tax=Marinobacterium zhoushanense TaxID=1679163 RepID=A0ABQ1K9I5_9GAMM|nr:ATP-binding protein [Marinobacterium zhoushanense]GGB91110.1 hypothetical protein GCM10011352_16440 [Marinobacterium zhoushanense]
MKFINDLGKYRAIVISVALFIFLDAGVLVLNFYISSQIADDATNVNLAGRQRMLSQKATKALFDYRQEYLSGGSGEAPFREMLAAVSLFDKTLQAFDQGGETLNASGQPIYLAAVTGAESRATVAQSLEIWQPILRDFHALEKLHADPSSYAVFLNQLVDSARANNLGLLKLMNDLTNQLETVARNKSETLRMIQAAAITLAILNFFLILFHFIGQLRRSDAVADEARRETQEILSTVREGLLLLDDQLVIGSQYSGSIPEIFGEQEVGGTSFRDLLQSLVSEGDMNTTEEYIKLLLNHEVKENLIGSLNPLSDVEVSVPSRSGGLQVKHLSFRFNRAIEAGRIRHILVTVLDITETVRLRDELEQAQARQSGGLQMGVLKELLKLDQTALAGFLSETEGALLAINEILREKVEDMSGYRDKVNGSYRIMHKIKGDAGTLGLPHIVDAAHNFEDGLEALRNNSGLKGGDFLPLTLSLNAFLELIAELKEMVALFPQRKAPVAVVAPSRLEADKIERLARRIAQEQGKSVELDFDLTGQERLSAEQLKQVQECLIQLVRNAVVHGIEPEVERLSAGKGAVGRIAVSLRMEEEGVRIGVRDDGRGIDLKRLRDRALAKGLYSEQEVETLPRTRLLSLIFEPGFSTEDSVHEHAGRGVGMDLVRAGVNRLKGRLRIANKARQACEISFLIPNESLMEPSLAEVV